MTTPTDRKSRVLAVDDNRANLLAIEGVLHKTCDVVLASSGAEAIAYLTETSDIDVILMDIQMPVMDGYEAASRIKAIPHCADIPLIFVTAIFTEDPHIKKGYLAGAVDYFSKPFDPEILRLKVGIYASYRRRAEVLNERERQIRASELVLKAAKKMTAVLEGLDVGVIVADLNGNICQTNEEVARLVNAVEVGATDAYGRLLSWWDQAGHRLKEANGALARALTEGVTTPNQTLAVRCIDGSTRTLFASTSPLRGIDDRVLGAVIVIRDVTEHRKIEADFQRRISGLLSMGVELEQSAPVEH
jgi:PAS domain S-box-containing protein